MGRLSKHDYEVKLECIRKLMIKGYSDGEILAKEGCCARTLRGYKAEIRKRRLDHLPKINDDSLNLFLIQIERFNDVIKRSYKAIETGERSYPYLKIIFEVSKNILDYSFKVGIRPRVVSLMPKEDQRMFKMLGII